LQRTLVLVIRHQIVDLANARPKHMAELLAEALL
jgi:hypothetical protein